MADTINTPFNTAWPNNAMNPMAADTLSGIPVMASARMPPK